MRQLTSENQRLEISLGHIFNNKDYLIEALTHSTFAYEHRFEGKVSNERLEFLGDAVLDLAVSTALFDLPEMHHEGFMSKTRALIVCENTLAQLARQLGLGDVLLLGRGEAATGGSAKPSNLSNAVEALFGAIFLDAGFDKARTVILNLLAGPINEALAGSIVFDYKSRLLEYIQSMSGHSQLRFIILDEQGPVHERIFTAGVLQEDRLIGRGSGNSKKEAEQQAARDALTYFGQ